MGSQLLLLVSLAGFHLNMVSIVYSNDNCGHQRNWLCSGMQKIQAKPSLSNHRYTPIFHTFIAIQYLGQIGVQSAQFTQSCFFGAYAYEQVPDE